MNISILASGTRGDVQPYIGLGVGLKQGGHTIRILTSDDFEDLVAGAGLEFGSIGDSIEAILQNDEWRAVTEKGNFLLIVSKMQAEMKKRAYQFAEKIPPLLTQTDMMIAGAGGMGFSIAEKLKIPLVQAFVYPFTPTSEFPSPLTPKLPFGDLLNRASFHIMRQMIWQSGRMGDTTVRRELGLKRGSFFGHYRQENRLKLPVLYGYSRHVIPKPTDWDAHHHVTGYWFLDHSVDWQPPQDLVSFLEAGSPPVYIGFGSMGSRNPEETLKIALKALALSGQRGILASGWGGMNQADLPETVYMLPSIPHSWLFPKMATVVHHGGAGTTAAGLRAGVPTIITPFMGDQAFWGHRVAQLGVGTNPIPRKKLTAENLASAIQESISNQTMRQKACELGEKISRENGIINATTLIEQFSQG